MLRVVNPSETNSTLKAIGCSPESIPIFEEKEKTYLVHATNIDYREATILKQTFLSKGGDVAVHKNVLDHTIENSSVLYIGTKKIYKQVLLELKKQPYFNLPSLSRQLETFLHVVWKKEESFLPAIMGIVNVTPDSFSDGNQFTSIQSILELCRTHIANGASILDIGGESSRPGSDSVSLEEELNRVHKPLLAIRNEFPFIQLSIDTMKPKVAETALDLGVNIVNCIHVTPSMLEVVARYPESHLVIMHMKGTPKTMQNNTHYRSILHDIHSYFENILLQTSQFSISQERVILDPGIGFGKTPEQNIYIMNNLSSFFDLNCRLLVGHSRKSFFGKLLSCPVEERDLPTAVLSTILCNNGVDILRVHNVKSTTVALATQNMLKQS